MTDLKKGRIWKIKKRQQNADSVICGNSVAANINYIICALGVGGQGRVFKALFVQYFIGRVLVTKLLCKLHCLSVHSLPCLHVN